MGGLIFVLSNSPVYVWGGESLKGEVVRVRLYSDRAEVTRLVKSRIGEGMNSLVVEGLPSSVLADSTRVKQVDGDPVEITHVNSVRRFGSRYLSAEINKQEEIVKTLQGRIGEVEDEIDTVQQQLDFISLLVQKETDKIKADLSASGDRPASWDKILDFISSRGLKLRNSLHPLESKKKDLAKELEAEKKKLQDLVRGARKVFYDVELEFASGKPGPRGFELTYQVRNTGWRPVYHLRADTEKKAVSIEYFGGIRQRTGEDWKNVELQLSTGRPALGAQVPKLPPWVVDFRKPAPPVRPMLEKKMMRAPMASAPEEEADALASISAAVVETGNALLYFVPGRQSVPTGTDDHRARITLQSFPVQLKYKTVPKYSNAVFLSGESTNRSEYHFLPGKASVYVDEDFVGKTWFESVAPGQEIKLGLGADTSFKVERKLVKKEGGEEGLFNKKKRMRFVYEIKLQNFKKESVTLEVLDQIPLPYHEEIVVRENKIDPAPVKKDEKNILTWEIILPPGVEKQIRMDFQVEYPKDKIIDGL